MSEAVLAVDGLTVAYDRRDGGPNTVVWNATLTLAPGTILGLAGESGCGKSTTALAAIGYRSPGTRILAGRSMLGDLDLLALPRDRLRGVWGKRVAYVAQNASTALNPAIPVGRQLAQPLARHLHLRGAQLRARQVELFDAVGLPDPERALDRYPHQFSGGQQQRIAIAIALSCRPEVLVLDEPTTGLDVTTQARISALLRALVDQSGVATLYVSHDLALLGTVSDSLAVMYGGQIVEQSESSELARRPRHPYAQALLAAVPDVGRPHVVQGIPGRPPATVVPDACPFAPRCPHVIDACREGNPDLRNVDGHLVRCIRAEELGVAPPPPPALPLTEAADQGALLEVRDLRMTYGHGRSAAEVVHGVSISLRPAETLGIVGESGSGKSTLLRAIAGLHPPSAGTITLRGEPLPARAVARNRTVRREIQLVFQNPDSSLNPRHTVGQIVGRPIRLFRDDVPRSREREAVRELLEAVKLPGGMLHRYASELSGGQKQRVALARAFAAQPLVLLCDEVTSALDVSVQATILELIAELSQRFQTAVLFVSHDLAVVRTIAARAVVMRSGEVCEEGDTETLFAAPAHPYTRELLASIPELAAI